LIEFLKLKNEIIKSATGLEYINEDDIKDILVSLSKKHILTISDVDSFIEVGGIVQFVTVGRKIKFKINNKSAQKAGIKISSKLLRLAIKVVR